MKFMAHGDETCMRGLSGDALCHDGFGANGHGSDYVFLNADLAAERSA